MAQSALSLLRTSTLVAGLKAKVADVIANFNQLITFVNDLESRMQTEEATNDSQDGSILSNTTHRGSDGSDHEDVVANTAAALLNTNNSTRFNRKAMVITADAYTITLTDLETYGVFIMTKYNDVKYLTLPDPTTLEDGYTVTVINGAENSVGGNHIAVDPPAGGTEFWTSLSISDENYEGQNQKMEFVAASDRWLAININSSVT